MSTLALKSAYEAVPAAVSRPRRSLLQRLIEAREKEALRHIHAFLASKSDERLADFGFTAQDIQALRRGK